MARCSQPFHLSPAPWVPGTPLIPLSVCITALPIYLSFLFFFLCFFFFLLLGHFVHRAFQTRTLQLDICLGVRVLLVTMS